MSSVNGMTAIAQYFCSKYCCIIFSMSKMQVLRLQMGETRVFSFPDRRFSV